MPCQREKVMNMKDLTLENDKKSQTTAFFIALAIYLGFLSLLYFLKIIYTPPEEEGLGINYGVDLVGYGDIQTYNKASDSKNNYDVKPSDDSPEEKPAKTKVTPPPPVPVEKVEKVKTKPVAEKPVIKSETDEKSAVIKEKNTPTKKVEVKTPPVETPTKPVTKPNPAPPQPETKPVDRSVDNGSVMKKKSGSSGSNGTVGTRDGVGGNNNGNGKPGEIGDKGDPKGDIDSKSQMGKPGGKGGGSGTGVSVSGLSGWSKKPFSVPKDNSDETGKIVFKVTIDDSGDVVGITVVETTVSPSVVNFYKSNIQQRLSKYLVAEGTPPDRATGMITINIRN